MVEVYDDVCEDAEEVEGDETQDCPVLCTRGEKVRDTGFAAFVDGLEAAATGGGVVSVGYGVVSCGLVVEEGLGGGDVGGGMGGGHCEGRLVVGVEYSCYVRSID